MSIIIHIIRLFLYFLRAQNSEITTLTDLCYLLGHPFF